MQHEYFELKGEFLANMFITGLPRKIIQSPFLGVFKNEVESSVFGS